MPIYQTTLVIYTEDDDVSDLSLEEIGTSADAEVGAICTSRSTVPVDWDDVPLLVQNAFHPDRTFAFPTEAGVITIVIPGKDPRE